MTAPDLVLHLGLLQNDGATFVRAFNRLRPQLREHGVGVLGNDKIFALREVAGSVAHPRHEPARAEAFVAELASALREERNGADTVLMSAFGLLGRRPLGPDDATTLRPAADESLAQVLAASGARSIRIVYSARRQDRLLELSHLVEVMSGSEATFAGQFPYRFRPVVDHGALVVRLAALPGVTDVRVHLLESVRHGPAAAADEVLDAVGLRGRLELPADRDLPLQPVYAARGMRIARAMSPHLDQAEERALVREFLLERYATDDDTQTRFVRPEMRARILAAYDEANRAFLAAYRPDLPADAYADDAATERALAPEAPEQTWHDWAVLTRSLLRRAGRRAPRH